MQKITSKEDDDVCQVGIELAKKYSTTRKNYEDIWTAAQDMFEDSMEGKAYTLKPEIRKEYARKLSKYLESGKYIGKSHPDRY